MFTYSLSTLVFAASLLAELRRKSKEGLAWNQDNVSELSNMSTPGRLFQ
jgi:hypothetical protein